MSADLIDLRSDTVTIPDAGMRAAMAAASVGDDVWGEDPTVRLLEETVADRLGKEAALYVPSGTMGNLICVAAQTRPGDEVIADAQAHVVIYEVGGTAVVAGVQLRVLDPAEGTPAPGELRAAIRGDNVHFPVSRLLCVENTHNRRGGAAVPPERIDAAAAVAREHGLLVHCDGARLFNAAVALGCAPSELVASCNTVSVCFSKGLGAPVGSAVAGTAAFIDSARRWRKRLGGGMRQAGIIAAGALHALHHNVDRLAEDHANAARIAGTLRDAGIRIGLPSVPTNIVIIETEADAGAVADRIASQGVLVTVMGPRALRCVTHLGVSAEQCDRAAAVVRAELAA